jgi:hypothetical protein
MAVKISVTVGMEDRIREALALVGEGAVPKKLATTLRQLIALVDDAKQKVADKPKGGLNPHHVIAAIRGVLGARMVLPPNPGGAFYSFIKTRTNFLGVTLDDVERAAIAARDGWKGLIQVESVVRKMDTLLASPEADGTPHAEAEESEPEWQIVTGR